MQGVDWKRFFAVVVALLLLGNLANNYYERRDRLASEPPSTVRSAIPELRVMSSSQSADGVSDADITPQFADALGKYGEGRLAMKFEAMDKQAGISAPSPQIRSESTVVKAQGKSLAIIRYEINGAGRAVDIVGISGKNLDRVMCTRGNLDEILIATGPCAQKIQEVHGVKIGG